jgi:flagellar biosynthesis GTPase FlhF
MATESFYGGFTMAVVRARSAPPYALILFVFLWVVSTALAVTFYLSGSKAQEDAATAKKSYDAAYSPRDQAFMQQLLAEKGTGAGASSALGIANQQISSLKKLIGSDAPVPQIVAPNGDAATALAHAGIANGSLLDAVTTLSNELAAAKKSGDALQANLTSLEAQVQADQKNYTTASSAANQSAEDFKKQLATATTESAAAQADKTKAIEQAEKSLSDAKDQAEADRRDKVLQIEQMKDQLAQKDARIATLTDEIDKLRPTSKTNVGRQPAGTVVRAATGAGEVYISLGSRDHITPGLTFAVYDPQSGVRFDNDEDAAGKGSIEVLDVGDSESLCRITSTTKGQAVQAGDLIANPVYQHDKNRVFHFVVVGDFDLDGDGVATPAERDRLIRMVKNWGGVIDDKVSTQTDFLVAGIRPSAPMVSSDETPGSVTDERSKKQQAYDDMITEAKRSTVPILNGNRFLAMVGYGNSTVVR